LQASHYVIIMSLFLTTLFFSLFITIALVPLFTKLATRLHFVDVPEGRKVHQKPVPRVGGAAMALGVFVTALAFFPKNDFVLPFLAGMGTIVLFGLLDDIKGLGYRSKFAGQIAAALIIIVFGKVRIVTLGDIIPAHLCLTELASFVLTFLVIIGVTNAINLADGLDGLAGGICFMAFCCIAYLAYKTGMTSVFFFSVSIVGVLLGFLRFNTYPATVFMGDTGSQLLGYSGIVLAIKLTQESPGLSPVLPLFFFGLPILDTLSVMVQRMVEGKSPFIADNNHMHHKLMRLGLSHTEAVFSIYLAQSLLIILGLFFRSWSDLFLFMIFLLFSAFILAGFTVSERHGYTIKRFDIIDNYLKAKVIRLKRKGILIRICFFLLKLTFPILLVFSVFLPASIPQNLAYIAGAAIVLVGLSLVFRNLKTGPAVRMSIYFIGPFIIYFGQVHMAGWLTHTYSVAYDFSFLFLAFLSIATLKLTRRKKGFKFSTMDFLILVILLVVLILPDKQVRSHHLGMLASKIVILFFSFEILVGEMRGKWGGLALTVLIFSLTTTARALNLF